MHRAGQRCFELLAADEGCRWELKARNSAVQLCAYLTWATMWNILSYNCAYLTWLELQGWWLLRPPNCQWKLTWLPRSRPWRTSRYCSFDFRGHAEGSPCSRDSLWLSLLQRSSDFSLVSKVPQVKNRLFPTNHLPLCKPIRFAS